MSDLRPRHLKVTDRVLPGDVLRARRSFTNPDLLTKGDVVIVQSQGEGGNIVVFNLYRNAGQYGWSPERFDFVHRPATRLKPDYAPHPTAADDARGGESELDCLMRDADRLAARMGAQIVWDPEKVESFRRMIAKESASPIAPPSHGYGAPDKARNAPIPDDVAGAVERLTYISSYADNGTLVVDAGDLSLLLSSRSTDQARIAELEGALREIEGGYATCDGFNDAQDIAHKALKGLRP